jgi:hypothetical protein
MASQPHHHPQYPQDKNAAIVPKDLVLQYLELVIPLAA